MSSPGDTIASLSSILRWLPSYPHKGASLTPDISKFLLWPSGISFPALTPSWRCQGYVRLLYQISRESRCDCIHETFDKLAERRIDERATSLKKTPIFPAFAPLHKKTSQLKNLDEANAYFFFVCILWRIFSAVEEFNSEDCKYHS